MSYSDWKEIPRTRKGKETKTEFKQISGEIKVCQGSWHDTFRIVFKIRNDYHEQSIIMYKNVKLQKKESGKKMKMEKFFIQSGKKFIEEKLKMLPQEHFIFK